MKSFEILQTILLICQISSITAPNPANRNRKIARTHSGLAFSTFWQQLAQATWLIPGVGGFVATFLYSIEEPIWNRMNGRRSGGDYSETLLYGNGNNNDLVAQMIANDRRKDELERLAARIVGREKDLDQILTDLQLGTASKCSRKTKCPNGNKNPEADCCLHTNLQVLEQAEQAIGGALGSGEGSLDNLISQLDHWIESPNLRSLFWFTRAASMKIIYTILKSRVELDLLRIRLDRKQPGVQKGDYEDLQNYFNLHIPFMIDRYQKNFQRIYERVDRINSDRLIQLTAVSVNVTMDKWSFGRHITAGFATFTDRKTGKVYRFPFKEFQVEDDLDFSHVNRSQAMLEAQKVRQGLIDSLRGGHDDYDQLMEELQTTAAGWNELRTGLVSHLRNINVKLQQMIDREETEP